MRGDSPLRARASPALSWGRILKAPSRPPPIERCRWAVVIGRSKLDLDVDACWQVELHQRIDGLWCGVDDVEEPLVRPHLELLARRLVDVRAPQHRPPVDDRRQQ